jgi:hypothetical protein
MIGTSAPAAGPLIRTERRQMRRERAPTIDELTLADQPQSWRELGFTVSRERCRIGAVDLRLAGGGAGRGIVGWSLRDLAGTELDGLPTSRGERPPEAAEPAAVHPNGVVAIDHVVAISPDLDRSVRVLQAAGLDLRRRREEPTPAGDPRQAFFRLGEVILEVVQEPEEVLERAGGSDRPAFFWGLALRVADLERTVEGLGAMVGSVRPAVQPGRRIATLRRSAGLGVPVALIS